MPDNEFGYFDESTIDAYLKHLLDPASDPSNLIYNQDVVDYYITPERAKEISPKRQIVHFPSSRGTMSHGRVPSCSSPVFARMLYLDIGRWGGSGDTRDNTESHWARCRDFGLVCGSTAALCTYRPEDRDQINPYRPPEMYDRRVLDSEGYRRMEPLLRHLSTSRQLGRVTVVKIMMCNWSGAEKPGTDEIHVFLGDIHAPILTSLERSLFQRTRDIRLFGRINLPLAQTTAIIGGTLALIPLLTNPIFGGAQALAQFTALAQVLHAQQKLTEWPDDDTIDYDDALDWFHLYHGEDSKKGADIFEQAGADLLIWIDLLRSYQEMMDPTIHANLRFVQTGDLFDFWIGLKTGIEWGEDINHVYDANAVRQFLDFWLRETTDSRFNNQASAISHMMRMDNGLPDDRKIDPTFLYGNHDNYLGFTGLVQPSRALYDWVPGMHSEHGHYCDSFNQDKDSSKGWALTQLAYLVPQIRDIEDKASAILATVTSDIDQRLKHFQHALDRCVFDPMIKNQKPKLTYIMGHTHRPMLKELRVMIRG